MDDSDKIGGLLFRVQKRNSYPIHKSIRCHLKL